MDIIIRDGTVEELFQVHQSIPEFYEKTGIDFYRDRLKDRLFLASVAEVGGKLVGFKVGYESSKEGLLYSWMGGVIPEFRKSGVASKLADAQEKWAIDRGFTRIYFKTRNRFPDMIKFGLKRNFKIVEVIRRDSVEDFRIVMVKSLEI